MKTLKQWNKSGIELIAEERQRQIEVEGWTLEHDKAHDEGELAVAAAAYAFAPFMDDEIRDGYKIPPSPIWPKYWLAKWWKPCPFDRIRELQKAGALIAAEIDRIQNEVVANVEFTNVLNLEKGYGS